MSIFSIMTRLVGLLISPMLFWRHRRVADFLQHVVAFDQFAKRRVLMIEPRYRRETNKKLRAG